MPRRQDSVRKRGSPQLDRRPSATRVVGTRRLTVSRSRQALGFAFLFPTLGHHWLRSAESAPSWETTNHPHTAIITILEGMLPQRRAVPDNPPRCDRSAG
jgi:hypothetical protein